MKTRPSICLSAGWMLVLFMASATPSAAEPGLLDRYWDWCDRQNDDDDVEGVDDAIQIFDNHLRKTDLDELTRVRSRFNSVQKAMDERLVTALGHESRLKAELHAEYVVQKAANPGRSVELTLQRAKESTNYSQRLALHRADSQSLSAMRAESATNASRLEQVGNKIEQAEEGLAAGKSKSPFKVKGWLQGLGKFLEAADLVGTAVTWFADVHGIYEGDTSVQDLAERVGGDLAKRAVLSKAAAGAGAMGSATGVLAPVAIPVLVIAASEKVSTDFDNSVGALMDRRRQERADERARQLYAMEPEELARRRAENRARSQRENAEAAALAQRQPKGVSIDQLRSDVQACYARWDEEKKKEQQAQAAVPPPAPDIGAALHSVGTMITSTLSNSTLNSMLSPDLQAALASVKSLLQPPAAPPVPTTPPPAVIATLQQQAAAEISTVVVQQLQASTKAETTAKSQPVPSRKSAAPIQTTQSKESSSEDLDEIIRQIRIKAIQAASDAVTKTPR
ncbi:hypothetical protein [Prosthecobacter sp.]|uniref:hypothetical protein n=1 Tax=Prosthecobacter sp. TaxID=1965333 RepID=UPI001D68DB13|nr:hypothetical protein [Prosthecobacter sp.]MCB1279587.1 hypothetical protein [Prosthecobacter sp.]